MINEEKMDEVLLELGHDDFSRGTDYVRQAVKMYEPGMPFTKQLYPALAKANDTTPGAIERSMRHSIEKAWTRGDERAQLRYFGCSVDPDSGKPTVSEYVCRLARICHHGLGR